MAYETILYTVKGAIATITLNRPQALNTIVPAMPEEIEHALGQVDRDSNVKVVILRGAGRAFCAGFNFGKDFHEWTETHSTDGKWDPGKDFTHATTLSVSPTQKFMSIWRCSEPVIAQIHGWCIGGGSEYGLCADLVIASDDAQIGTPYSRVWGCHLSGMWIYRLGLAKAMEYALTGKAISGKKAAEIGLINESVPFAELEATVLELAESLAKSPLSQLQAMKLIVNQAYENMGLHSTQLLGPILDGLMRNTAEGLAFVDVSRRDGVKGAITKRDEAWGDYSQAPKDQQPDPNHIIYVEQRKRPARTCRGVLSLGATGIAKRFPFMARGRHTRSIDRCLPSGN
jgi:enoyl-CoA hydratase